MEGGMHMSVKDYLIKRFGITEDQFDKLAMLAYRIKNDDVPVCKELRHCESFEELVAYGMIKIEKEIDSYGRNETLV